MSSVSSRVNDSRLSGDVEAADRQQGRAESLVLHIHRQSPSDFSSDARAREGGAAGMVAGLLASTRLRVASCPSVYQGLARLLNAGVNAPGAVFVCVEGLGPSELEFFSVVARVRPTLSVYVYGESWSESAITRAIELGAVSRVTKENVRALEVSLANRPSGDFLGPSPAEAARPVESTRILREEYGSHDAERDIHPADEDSEKVSEDSAAGNVRVPWLRRRDVPVRIAPHQRVPAGDAQVTPETSEPTALSGTSQPAPEEPLLTPEELQALTGQDDISALAPPPNDTAGAEGQPGGRTKS